ncbi:hypothetical protein [Dysgonomonas sp. Marseille-P4361]|uniref:hypothetical protein n=1 Tax=Dysgonomonas sp. Marseille-P4361 TaxID=2161820 RepID=UPI000D54B785|nr:hypothetical protein [Dysgonomonas sp. Marseille-P4361]
MTADKDKLKKNEGLDTRLGAPMKKIAGLSSDMKKSESEHLHAFREDVNIGEEEEEQDKDNEEDISTC